nr:MAG TPA: hypothetical protein [Crassvirales sp.]
MIFTKLYNEFSFFSNPVTKSTSCLLLNIAESLAELYSA